MIEKETKCGKEREETNGKEKFVLANRIVLFFSESKLSFSSVRVQFTKRVRNRDVLRNKNASLFVFYSFSLQTGFPSITETCLILTHL